MSKTRDTMDYFDSEDIGYEIYDTEYINQEFSEQINDWRESNEQ